MPRPGRATPAPSPRLPVTAPSSPLGFSWVVFGQELSVAPCVATLWWQLCQSRAISSRLSGVGELGVHGLVGAWPVPPHRAVLHGRSPEALPFALGSPPPPPGLSRRLHYWGVQMCAPAVQGPGRKRASCSHSQAARRVLDTAGGPHGTAGRGPQHAAQAGYSLGSQPQLEAPAVSREPSGPEPASEPQARSRDGPGRALAPQVLLQKMTPTQAFRATAAPSFLAVRARGGREAQVNHSGSFWRLQRGGQGCLFLPSSGGCHVLGLATSSSLLLSPHLACPLLISCWAT